MPNERWCEVSRRVLDMNDTPMGGPRGGAGGMKEERTEGEDSAGSGETHRLGLLCTNPINRVGREAPKAMRAVNDPNGSVVDGTRIEMQPNGEHILEDIARWLHVRDAGLLSPWAVASHVNASLSRDRQILMPDHLPVRVGSFVEEQGADRKTGVAENGTRKLP